MREALKILAGSIGVYVVVAACSARGGDQPFVSGPVDPGTGGDGPTAMAGTSGGQGIAGYGSGGMMGASGTGSSGMNGSAGTTEPTDAGLMDAIAEAMTDPVPDASADPNTSGTRLRAVYLVGSDGSRQFQGWRDTERNENCSFSVAADGMTRCLPSAALFGGIYFTDAACTAGIVVDTSSTTCAAGMRRYAYTTATTCTSGGRILALTAASIPSALYVGSGTTCIPATVSESMVFYSGSEVQPSAFVAAAEEVE